jgi:multicomponent Na+:H+ antiporter subunit E
MKPLRQAWYGLRLVAAFSRDLVVSSLHVARAVLWPGEAIRPRFVVVPLKHARSAPEITVVANYITLTPGTLTVDVSPDRSKLLVHCLLSDDTGDGVRADIRDGIEVRVTRVSRP